MKLTALCAFWFVSALSGVLAQIPEFIKPCRRSDPELDECVADSVAHLRNFLVRGIPELELPPIDPLNIPRIQMENGVGRIRIKAVFSNVSIHGAANHTLMNVRARADRYTMDIAARVPRLFVTGRYEVSGNVLVVNIRSTGDFQAVFDRVSGFVGLHGKEVLNEGVKYMKIDRVGVDFRVGRARFRVRDSNNKVLGEAINNFLNDNWREVIEEMKYTASTAMGNYLQQVANGALLKVPLNLWLLED